MLVSGPDMARTGSGGMRGGGALTMEAMTMIRTPTSTTVAMAAADDTMIDTMTDTATMTATAQLDLAVKTTAQVTSASSHRRSEINGHPTQPLVRLQGASTRRPSILEQPLQQAPVRQRQRT